MQRFLLPLLLSLSALVSAAEPRMPPRNPYLADSVYALGHVDSAQQDSTLIAGSAGPTRRLDADEIDYLHLGPAHFGEAISSPYADGRRVIWSNGLDRIVKIDHDSFRLLATYRVGEHEYSESEADEAIGTLETRSGLMRLYTALRLAGMLRDLSGVYTLLDRDNRYYVGDKQGVITVYGDAEAGNPDSGIEIKGRFRLPPEASGLMVGMNMSYDGWLIVATENGYLVAVSRDLRESRVLKLKHSDGAADKAAGAGYGWIRNGLATDERGAVYVASQEHMHCAIWTGRGWSQDEKDGAWTARYRNGGGGGTGSTPSLMGFGDEDRFVVITDGDALMNLTLFWRERIPSGWRRLDGAPSRRIAGFLPANMGDPAARAVQSEQSVVVSGYGAVVVNNQPANVPWYLPKRAAPLLISYLGSDPAHQPHGMQKFAWDPVSQQLREAWVNREISSPNSVPIASVRAGMVYTVGARDGQWTLEGIDFASGASLFHYVIGGERYNSLFAGLILDQQGRITYGTTWGKVRLRPH